MLPAMSQVAYAYSAGDIAGTTGSGASEADPVVCDTFAEFKAAMENTEITYVKLTGTIETIPAQSTLAAAIEQTSPKTLIVEGTNTFVAPLNGNNNCLLYVRSELNVKGSGTLEYRHGMGAGVGAVIYIAASHSLTIQDVTLVGNANGATFGGALYLAGGSKTKILSGTFSGYSASVVYDSIDAVIVDQLAELTIEDGSFYATANADSIKTYGLVNKCSTTKVTLNGGTYDGINASDANLNLSDMLGTDCYYTDSNGTVDMTSVTNTTERLTVKTKRIDAVDVNISVPVVGNHPQNASSNTENTKALSTEWSFDGTRISETDTFEAGKTYKARVSVYPTYNYFFADALTVTINGSTAVTDFWRSGSAIIFEVEFTPENGIIDTVDVKITEPVAGAHPQDAVSNTANVSVSTTEWYHNGTKISASDTFAAGETYKVHVIVYPDSGYEFADNPTATFNGSKTGTLYTNGKGYINYYAEFTAVNAPIDSVDVKITEPVAGAQPQDAVSNTANVSVGTTEWYHNGTKMSASDTFAAGQTYKVHVIVYPDSGYEFADNPTATFNGSKTGTLYTNGKDYINYYAEFTTTAESTEYAITVTNGKATVGAGTEISKAAEGTTVTLTANAAPDGQMFDKWEVVSGSITLADANSATTTFTMPAGAASVKATYTSYITVNLAAGEGSGTMEPLILKGTYGYYELIAPDCTFTPPANKVFDKWQFSKDDSYLNPGDTKTIWSSANGATLTAIWKDAPVTYYTVSFDANGGTGSMADATGVSGDYVLPVCGFTAPNGKQFKAWSVGGVEKAAGDTINVTANTTVTAIWEAIEYNVTVTGGTASVGAGTPITKATMGTTVTLTAGAAPSGQMFDKWVVNGVVVDDANSATTTFVMPAGNVTAEATYKNIPVVTYTVTFNANGGTGSMADATGVSGDYVLPVCGFTAPNGKQFKAWSVGGVEKAAGDTITVNANTTVTAIWENIPVTYYTVTFDSNGGSAVTAQSIEAGQKATKPADPTKDGYDFKGWTLNGSAYDFNTAVNGNITLVATWEQQQVVPTTYTVSFAANGGTGTMADVTGISGEYTLPENGFTAPDGKQFKAWSVGGVEKAVGDKITVTANTTVTAVWENIPVVTYTVFFDANGGSVTPASAVTGADGKLTSLPTPTRSGSYSFDGWYTAASGGTTVTTSYQFTADTTVCAHWTYTGGSSSGGGVSTYAITVDSAKNGTITVSPKSAAKGTAITLTVEPDKGYTLETLTVTDKDGKEVKLTEKDGKYTFTMPASKVTVKATFMEDNSMLNFFVDVPADAYYYDAVLWAAENGITGGVDDTHFAPNATCTRAQIVTFLWRAAGSPEPTTANSFADVPADSYYAKAVAWAVEQGITTGTGDGKFSPNAPCTRAQSVTFLWRSQKSPASDSVNPFTDVVADTYYNTAVLWAAENGITGGTSATTFSPNNDCTRAQIVTFLYRCLG